MHMAQRDPRDEDFRAQMISPGGVPQQVEDPLDDVFGSDSGSPVFESEDHSEARETHPSDIRRLQAEHVTAGYREGITAAKTKSIQVGFDEGFSLGATIGLKAGQVLGFLEGITGALQAEHSDESQEARRCLEEARKELAAESIYDEKYWAPDGTWKYDLQSVTPENDIIFDHVAAAHPLISKWNGIIVQQLNRWSVDMQILSQDDETPTSTAPDKKEVRVEQQPREMLEW